MGFCVFEQSYTNAVPMKSNFDVLSKLRIDTWSTWVLKLWDLVSYEKRVGRLIEMRIPKAAIFRERYNSIKNRSKTCVRLLGSDRTVHFLDKSRIP